MTLSIDLRDKVLQSFGLTAPPTVDERGLAEIYAAWCRNVPFDNIRKWIHVARNDSGPLPGDTGEDFFEAYLKYRTGGTCWAGNGALCELLQSLGFDAVRGVATMMVAPDLPPNHGTVIAKIEDKEWLVDASMLYVSPLPLQLPTITGAFGVRLSRVDDRWVVSWLPSNHPNGLDCRIDYYPADAADFAARHEATRAWSPFNYSLVVRTVRGQCTVGANGLEWYQLSSDLKFVCREVTRNERAEMLIKQLGYSEEVISQLPEDQPLPPPPGSATAARAAARGEV